MNPLYAEIGCLRCPLIGECDQWRPPLREHRKRVRACETTRAPEAPAPARMAGREA